MGPDTEQYVSVCFSRIKRSPKTSYERTKNLIKIVCFMLYQVKEKIMPSSKQSFNTILNILKLLNCAKVVGDIVYDFMLVSWPLES